MYFNWLSPDRCEAKQSWWRTHGPRAARCNGNNVQWLQAIGNHLTLLKQPLPSECSIDVQTMLLGAGGVKVGRLCHTNIGSRHSYQPQNTHLFFIVLGITTCDGGYNLRLTNRPGGDRCGQQHAWARTQSPGNASQNERRRGIYQTKLGVLQDQCAIIVILLDRRWTMANIISDHFPDLPFWTNASNLDLVGGSDMSYSTAEFSSGRVRQSCRIVRHS